MRALKIDDTLSSLEISGLSQKSLHACVFREPILNFPSSSVGGTLRGTIRRDIGS